jgi:hypothetical protein
MSVGENEATVLSRTFKLVPKLTYVVNLTSRPVAMDAPMRLQVFRTAKRGKSAPPRMHRVAENLKVHLGCISGFGTWTFDTVDPAIREALLDAATGRCRSLQVWTDRWLGDHRRRLCPTLSADAAQFTVVVPTNVPSNFARMKRPKSQADCSCDGHR